MYLLNTYINAYTNSELIKIGVVYHYQLNVFFYKNSQYILNFKTPLYYFS